MSVEEELKMKAISFIAGTSTKLSVTCTAQELFIADGGRALVFNPVTLQENREFVTQNGTHPSSFQNDVAMEYWNGALYIVNDGGLFAYDPMTGDLINQAVQTPSVDRGYALLMISQCNSIADINGDGELSGADFSAWVIAFNTNSSQCDQNHDGLCTPADFSAWVSNYNMGCS